MLGRLRTTATKILGMRPLPRSGWWGGGYEGYHYRTPSREDFDAALATAHRSSLVMACVEYLIANATSTPWIMTDADDTPLPSHPLVDVLQRPTAQDDATTFLAGVILSLALAGDAYALRVTDRSGTLRELQYVPHTAIAPVRDRRGALSHYRYTVDAKPESLAVADVLHVQRWQDWQRTYRGLSPLASLGPEIWIDMEATRFVAAMLRNRGALGLVMSPKSGSDDLGSPEDLAATRQYLEDNYTGENRGKTMVMGRPMDVIKAGFDPKSMNLKSMHDFAEERISGAFGLPAAVLQFGTGLERTTANATAAEWERQGWRRGVIPLQNLIARQVARQLLDDTTLRLGFDHSKVAVLQEDQNARATRTATLVGAGVETVAEGRRAHGYAVRPSDEIYLRALNLLEVPAGVVRPLPEGGATATRSLKQSSRAQRRLIQALRRDAAVLEQAMADDLVEAFAELGQRAERAYREAPDVGKQVVAPEDQGEAERILQRLHISQWQQAALLPAFDRHTLRTLEVTVGTINATLGLQINLPDAVARQIVQAGGTRAGLVDITDDTRRALVRALAKGRELGEGPSTLGRRIRSQVPSGRFRTAGPRYRAQLIARTETAYAQNGSAVATYKRSDVFTGVLVFDGDEDAGCAVASGQVWTFARAADEPLEHPQCTRSFAPTTESVGAA